LEGVGGMGGSTLILPQVCFSSIINYVLMLFCLQTLYFHGPPALPSLETRDGGRGLCPSKPPLSLKSKMEDRLPTNPLLAFRARWRAPFPLNPPPSPSVAQNTRRRGCFHQTRHHPPPLCFKQDGGPSPSNLPPSLPHLKK